MNGSLSDPDLWSRISKYQFPVVGDQTFERYVAEKTKYKLDDVQQMIDEYRRFVYLCVIAPGQVQPSSYVDEIWHLHLTLTQDYWERFCPVILGRKLHHLPGGLPPKASPKFLDTLRLYETEFGEAPPERYWIPLEPVGLWTVFAMVFFGMFCAGAWSDTHSMAIFGFICLVIIIGWQSQRRPNRRSGDGGGGCGDGGCGGD